MSSKCFFDIQIGNSNPKRIKFLLYDDVVPKTTRNFRELCTQEAPHGYKKSVFHRIIPDFMAQGGDFTHGTGVGGKSIYGSKFEDENFIKKHDKKYLLSMANAGPNTNGSQFFITFNKCDWLNNKHVVFGEVIYDDKKELEILKEMEAVGSQGGKPKEIVKIVDSGIVEK
ncbi:peptidylprolyl isomerase [Vairimorpha ceranae]|uniref:Peptidyl-prolyl cis-trans isomerase n=1 Tax=Vairimorpha ceranae TaxID=40302 RepID=A0A0F9WR60_9MICR|nr:peptidylprolyl isomerase [Vairimorpha ceranae]KAF5140602.1 hypothetical protein G9O61_00g014070 [Vairimorpha ceranae]KKO75393.1 peptidylprolyl isomerase [Vairimorpha ceranae]